MNDRINKVFSNSNKKLVTFVTGGDPDLTTSSKIIRCLAENGSDLIEIGRVPLSLISHIPLGFHGKYYNDL